MAVAIRWLIGFGVAMPVSPTIFGAFGGFVSFGSLGLFIGPTLIAVAFTLLRVKRLVRSGLGFGYFHTARRQRTLSGYVQLRMGSQ